MNSRSILKVASLVILCTFTPYLFGLAQESFGNAPISPNPEWPNGIEVLIKLSSRVYSVWVNGDEKFYYEGDVQAVNSFLKSFAAIKIPVHQIVVDNEWLAVKKLSGENVRYDWMLSVPSGIYRAHVIKEKGADANEQYPSVHISASNDIDFDRLIMPENTSMVWPKERNKNAYNFGIDAIYQAQQWSKAMAAWNKFADARITKIREAWKDPSRQWVEVKSELLSKWLPDYRTFVFETSVSGESSTFALNKAGTIFDVGSGEWSGGDNTPYRNKKLSSFLKKNNLKITDANAAVGVAKLVEELSFTAQTVMFLKCNTKNFRVFDKRFYESAFYFEKEWRYSAQKNKGYWQINKEYIGPPACISGPQGWRLVVDANNILSDVWCY
jgi:hypothetical protein